MLEDRLSCPCYLTVELPGNYENLYINVSSDDELIYEADITDEASAHIISVPRGTLRLSVWGSDLTCESFRDGGLTIPEGTECPPVYFVVDELDTYDDSVRYSPVLYKHFCALTVIMEAPGGQALGATVRGDVCGFGPNGLPIPGNFHFLSLGESLSSSCREYSVRVPRQVDPTLTMTVDSAGGTMTFPIGLYLEEAGYDWDEPDLRDVTLEIDSRNASVTVQTDQWRKSLSFDLVI